MASFILLYSILLCWAHLCVGQQHTITLPICFPSGSNGSQCISHEVMQEHRDKLRKTIMDYYNHSITNSPSTTDSPSTAYCTPYSCGSTGTSYSPNTTVSPRSSSYCLPCSCGGTGGWTRVAYLNMSDPDQQCPSNWNLITTPIRGCGRSSTEHLTCDSVFNPVNSRYYSSVCGRILAYQRGESYAFFNSINCPGYNNIEFPYVSGISLTHGPAGNRQHIWTFAGALHEHYNPPKYFT